MFRISSGGAAEDGGGGERERGGRRGPGVVGGARKKMERLRVEEEEKASEEGRESQVNRAKTTWGKLKEMFVGKKLVQDDMGGGRVQVEGGDKKGMKRGHDEGGEVN
jgi:hypothetical protein